MLELLQKQIYKQIKSVTTVPVYDNYSKLNDSFPIIVISEITEQDLGVKTHDIRQCKVQLDIYSSYSGNKEIYQIYDLIRNTITSNNLSSFDLDVMVKKPTVIILSDSVGELNVVKHAVINYEIMIKEA